MNESTRVSGNSNMNNIILEETYIAQLARKTRNINKYFGNNIIQTYVNCFLEN